MSGWVDGAVYPHHALDLVGLSSDDASAAGRDEEMFVGCLCRRSNVLALVLLVVGAV